MTETGFRSLDSGVAVAAYTFAITLPHGEVITPLDRSETPLSGTNLTRPHISHPAMLTRFGYPNSRIIPEDPYAQGGSLWASNDYAIFLLTNESGGFAEFPGCQQIIPVAHTLVVIKGDVAYEYRYAGTRRQFTYGMNVGPDHDGNPIWTYPQGCWEPYASGYLIHRIRNVFGDSINFSYHADGIGYTAEALVAGVPSGKKINLTLISAENPGGQNLLAGSMGLVRMKVSYEGSSTPIEYLVDGYDNTGLYDSNHGSGYIPPVGDLYGEKRRTLDLVRIQEVGSGIETQITYKTVSTTTPYPSVRSVNVVGIHAKVIDTIQTTGLERISFDYQPYHFNDDLGWKRFNTLAWGVSRMDHRDLVTNEVRTTTWEREHPSYVEKTYPTQWRHRRFWESETRPDGTTLLRLFVPPPDGPAGWPGEPLDIRLQAYLFSKNAVHETRVYPAGSAPAPGSVSIGSPMGNAVTLSVSDQWDIRSLGNPTANINFRGLPYPTRSFEYNRLTGVGVLNLKQGWNAATAQWSDHVTSFHQAGPESFGFAPVSLSSAFTGQTVQPSTLAGHYLHRRSVTTYLDPGPNGYPGLWTKREHFQGSTPRYPIETQNPDPATGVVTFRKWEGPDGWIQHNFTYVHAGLPATVQVTGGPSLSLSGAVGVTYGYDEFLRRNWIQPWGATWGLGQANDPILGLPTSQTDAQGLAVSYFWDSLGRLRHLIPPEGELSATVTYQGYSSLSILRGNQRSGQTMNAFGEVLSASRYDSAQTESTKHFRYDPGGRKTFESTYGKPAVGYQYAYDDPLHRQTKVTDPNGQVVHQVYSGLNKTLYQGWVGSPYRTQLTYDPLGRLETVEDALGQRTQYQYDSHDRLTRVQQSGAAGTQERTWTYNSLGWLTSMVQPESGLTEYGLFTVTGKPTLTRYGVVNGAAASTVTAAFDVLNRLRSLSSSDSTINQTFTYDEGGAAAKANGKLTTAQSGPSSRKMEYLGLNGRLSKLTRIVDGLTFTQGLAYDTYGLVATRTYPNGQSQVLTYDLAKGLPENTTFGGTNLATFVYDSTHWGLSGITHGNNASTFLTYGLDQVRLDRLVHTLPSGTLADWAYSYDPATGSLTSDGEDSYAYDPLGRLKGAFVRDPWGPQRLVQTFDYDAFGNRIQGITRTVLNWAPGMGLPTTLQAMAAHPADTALRAGVDGVAANATFNAGNPALLKNQMPSSTANGAPTGALYDVRGNLTSINKHPVTNSPYLNLRYDALGRVSSLYDSERAVSEVYTYDDEGLRVKIEVYQGDIALRNLQKKRYRIYNEARQLIAEYEYELVPE